MKKITIGIWSSAFLCLCSALILYPYLPKAMAVHWNLAGNVDGHGSSLLIFIFPLAMIGMDAMYLLLRKWDVWHSYVRFENVWQRFRIITCCFILSIFLLLCIENLYPNAVSLERMLTLVVACMLLIMGNYLPKIRPNFFIGIRTPWTLANHAVWQRTHWFSGRVWVACAIMMISTCLLPTAWMFYSVMMLTLLLILLPIAYSYKIFRKREQKENNYD